MAIRKVTRRGKVVLVIDLLNLKKEDGTTGRYRKDATIQVMAAAREEERRLIASAAMHSESSVTTSNVVTGTTATEEISKPADSFTFRDAVNLFRRGKAITALKPRTLIGYEGVLALRLLPRFGDRPIASLSRNDVTELDASMVEQELSVGTRRNTIVAFRSVLSGAHEAGKLPKLPELGKLPKLGKTILRTLTKEQVDLLLSKASAPGRLAMALAAYAGLRAGEVRGLRFVDVDLEAGTITVRVAVCRGAKGSPKSGDQRCVPIARPLRTLLEATPRGKGDDLVCVTAAGEQWGEHGLIQVLKRAAKRAAIGRWRYHDLRHFFVTHLFRSGTPAPTVQALAGHASLAVTQRYAHTTRADLASAVASAW